MALQNNLSLAFSLLFMVACGRQGENAPPKSTDSGLEANPSRDISAPTPSPRREEGEQKPVLISAEKLGEEFERDHRAAFNKYQPQLLRVDGIVQTPMVDLGSGVSLVGFRNQKGFPTNVVCLLEDQSLERAGTLTRGQKLTVEGRLMDGASSSVTMSQCKLVDIGVDPVKIISPEELAKDARLLVGKQVLIEGSAFAIDSDKTSITLMGAASGGGTRVVAAFGGDYQRLLEKKKAGEKVRVKGECRGLVGGKVLIDCYRLYP